MLSAVVLAAGSSSRMGTDNKLLLPFKNKYAIAVIVETIIEAGIKDIIVVTGYEAGHIKDALKNYQVVFTHNLRYAEGMTSSIQQGVIAAKGNNYMICLSDMVMITAADYKLLENAFQEKILFDSQCIIMPRYNNKHGNPVIFSGFYKKMILQNLQPEGCKNIVQSNTEHLYMIDMDTPHVLQDFDYPDDYKKLLQNHGLIF
jgi:molybdenum cofactor cytidylyltransferase